MNEEQIKLALLDCYLKHNKISTEKNWFHTAFEQSTKKLNISFNKIDLEIANYILKNPSKINFVDSGLSLFRKESELRKIFLLINALIECDVKNRERYMNNKNERFVFYKLFTNFILATFNSIYAIILFKIKGWK